MPGASWCAVSATSFFSSETTIMRSDPMRRRWLSIAEMRVARSLDRQDLLEREVLRQEARGLDQPAIPSLDHLVEHPGGRRELRLHVAPRAPCDRRVDRDERSDLDERDEGQERHDDARLEAAERHGRLSALAACGETEGRRPHGPRRSGTGNSPRGPPVTCWRSSRLVARRSDGCPGRPEKSKSLARRRAGRARGSRLANARSHTCSPTGAPGGSGGRVHFARPD